MSTRTQPSRIISFPRRSCGRGREGPGRATRSPRRSKESPHVFPALLARTNCLHCPGSCGEGLALRIIAPATTAALSGGMNWRPILTSNRHSNRSLKCSHNKSRFTITRTSMASIGLFLTRTRRLTQS
ncbi:unnamed protein product [Nezara viridula]|uniref:Uncharacterized protein n=1 Tax=Nezara viridula TaxID=85310 RepID=A0A9P0HE66_NEZVI|nr:unnamed protein product [Nezara viridula]